MKHNKEYANEIKSKADSKNIDIKEIIGNAVKVVIDRPIGTVHPRYKDIIYEVNYGYIEEYMTKEDESIRAYIIGESLPLHLGDEYEGKVIAILHRLNDDEDKIIVAPENRTVSDDEIISKTEFMEQYFVSEIIR